MSRFKVNIKHIEAFVEVADLGTFRRAAERLHTTQPSISNRIAQLEEYIGQRLMERDAGSVRLTPRGKALLNPARKILKATDSFLAAVDDETRFEGMLRIGVSELIAHTWLPSFLMEMRERFPGIDIDLTVDMSANLSKALFDRTLDLTIQNAPFDRVAVRTAQLGQVSHCWVAAPGLCPTERAVAANELASHPILSHARASKAFQQIDDHFRNLGLRPRLMSSSYMGSCLQMALNGLGVTCLPVSLLGDALNEGRLVRINYPWIPDDLIFSARYLADPAPTWLSEAVCIAQRIFPPTRDAG